MKFRGDVSHAEYIRIQSEVASSKRTSSLKRAVPDYRRFKLKFRRFAPFIPSSDAIICLGARRGTEVKALRALGFTQAFGIDIVDYDETGEFVVYGDFMDLQYPDDHFGFSYTNCFDHTSDPIAFVRGLQRVMRPASFSLLEAPDDTKMDGSWRAYWHWHPDSLDEIGDLITAGGGHLVGSMPIGKPYRGRAFVVKWKAPVTAAEREQFHTVTRDIADPGANSTAVLSSHGPARAEDAVGNSE